MLRNLQTDLIMGDRRQLLQRVQAVQGRELVRGLGLLVPLVQLLVEVALLRLPQLEVQQRPAAPRPLGRAQVLQPLWIILIKASSQISQPSTRTPRISAATVPILPTTPTGCLKPTTLTLPVTS